MTIPTQNNLAGGLPTRKLLTPEVVKRFIPRQINLRENLTSQVPVVSIASSITYFPGNKKWIQYLIDRFVDHKIKQQKQYWQIDKADEIATSNTILLDQQKKIDFAVNELQPKINPNNAPIKVYYFAARTDYIRIAAATNAGSLILGDIKPFYNSPVNGFELTQTLYEEIAESISWLGGQIIEKEINICSPEVLPLEDIKAKYSLNKIVEAGLLELKEGEIKTFNLGEKQVTLLRLTNEMFLSEAGYIINIKRTNHNDKSYQFGIVKFGIGVVNFKCQVPLFTLHPTERLQNITYHACSDANTSIPKELKDGYDVLYAKECFILKDNSIKQILYELLNSGGKAVFTIGEKRSLDKLKTDFPMFDFSNPVIVPVPESDYSYVIVEKN